MIPEYCKKKMGCQAVPVPFGHNDLVAHLTSLMAMALKDEY